MNKKARVLQIIDSLEAGGAEMMAVNITNLLNKKSIECHLCVTNYTGILQEKLLHQDRLIILNKKGKIDIKALRKLIKYVKINQINIIHAHSSSYLIGFILKLRFRYLKLIWHDHYGMSENLDKRKKGLISFCSKGFDRIIAVNENLRKWSETFFDANKVFFLNNFSVLPKNVNKRTTTLQGKQDIKIICLATFRPQKDHITLLRAFFELLKNTDHSISLHLIGTFYNDEYYRNVMSYIQENDKANNVFTYPPTNDIIGVLNDADIGVLSSKSEGLPLALLEYGLAKLPVVSTDVGQCKEVISHHGIVVEKENPKAFAEGLKKYIENSKFKNRMSSNYHKHIIDNYSEDSYYDELIKLYFE